MRFLSLSIPIPIPIPIPSLIPIPRSRSTPSQPRAIPNSIRSMSTTFSPSNTSCSPNPNPTIKIRPPNNIPRLPPPPADGFKSDKELQDFSSSIRLKHYLPLFNTHLQTLALRIPAAQASKIIKAKEVQGLVFSSPKISPIQPDPQGDVGYRVLQLNLPVPRDEDSRIDSTIPIDSEATNPSIPSGLKSLIETESYTLISNEIVLDFSYFNTDQILHSILPLHLLQNSDGVPTSFTSTGHIAHLNLRKQFLPYKNLIGDLILEKNKPKIRTVVNKLDSIDNVYRFFQMELLSGEPEFTTRVNEGDVEFEFDFRKVYWNSRLGTEHSRLVALMEPYQILVDVMAGVGPFALPAAKKGTWSLANDLNPDSFDSLRKNSQSNGRIVKQRMVEMGNIDGREFIRKIPLLAWEKGLKGERIDMSRRESWESDLKEMREEAIREKKSKLEIGKRRKLEKENQKLKEKEKEKHKQMEKQKQKQKEDSNGIGEKIANLDLAGDQNRGKETQDSIKRDPSSSVQNSTRSTSSISTSASTSTSTPRNPSLLPDHYVLNLPDSALTFLDSFRGSWIQLRDSIGKETLEKELKRRKETYGHEFPLVHVHCFTKETENVESSHRDVCQRANHYLSLTDHPEALRPPSDPNPTPGLNLHLVRAVAPNKDMYCLTFRLTREILFDESGRGPP